MAFSTFGMIFGWHPLFATPALRFENPLELGPYLLLALVVAFGGRVYPQVFYAVRDLFARLRLPVWLKPAIGGIITGAIGFFVPRALSTSFGVVQGAILGQLGAAVLIAVAVAKMLATAFTVGSGGSGGVFGPAVVIGGSLGGAVGIVCHGLWPTLVPEPGAFAMVGMAGFFASAAHVPISTVIMVSELTGNYQLLVPSMFVCLIGFLLVRRHGIYEKQLPNRAASPAHQHLILRTTLERTRVGDVLAMRPRPAPKPVRDDASIAEVLEQFAAGENPIVPVVDRQGALVGSIPVIRVRPYLARHSEPPQDLTAKSLARPVVTVTPEQSLFHALREMTRTRRSDLLVVDSQSGRSQVLGVLTGGDINAIYDSQFVDIGTEFGPGRQSRGLLASFRDTLASLHRRPARRGA